MNAELVEFLVGKKTPDKKTPGQEHSFQSPAPASPATPLKNNSSQRKSRKSTISSSFYKVLVQQWLDADKTAEEVLRSIVNLQDRISQELLAADRLKDPEPQAPWKACGFRAACREGLTLQDINMALDRDLIQHEAMLAQLRHYITTMAKAQESMGRRLSEWYDYDEGGLGVESGQALYVACAKELYRKQCMVQSVCDASAADIGNHKASSGSTAKTRLSKWMLSSKESHLLSKLNEIHELEQRFDE